MNRQVVASAVAGRARDEGLVGQFLGQSVHHAGFGQNDEGIGGVIFAVSDHFFSAAYLSARSLTVSTHSG